MGNVSLRLCEVVASLRVGALIVILLLSAASPVGADILLDVGGVLGPGQFTAGCEGGEELAASWTFASTFTNVSILAYVGAFQGLTGYLTTNIGPSATANDMVAAPVTIQGTGLVTVFSGLTLGANTYYLVIGDPGCGGWAFIAPDPPSVTTAAGVTHNTGFRATPPHLNPIFPPVSSFFSLNASNPLVYRITGDASSADGTPPQTTLTGAPTNPTSSTSATFTFSGTDDVTVPGNLTFECSLDDGGFGACTSGVTFTGLAAGDHTLQVRSKDEAGNVDPSPATFSWAIADPPVCAPPPSGMVSWWPGEGDANDIQGGHHGTLEGGMTFGSGEG